MKWTGGTRFNFRTSLFVPSFPVFSASSSNTKKGQKKFALFCWHRKNLQELEKKRPAKNFWRRFWHVKHTSVWARGRGGKLDRGPPPSTRVVCQIPVFEFFFCVWRGSLFPDSVSLLSCFFPFSFSFFRVFEAVQLRIPPCVPSLSGKRATHKVRGGREGEIVPV